MVDGGDIVTINGLKGVGHGPNLDSSIERTFGLQNTGTVASQYPCSVIQGWIVKLHSHDWYTVKPQFTNTSDHEQFGLQTNFPNTKRLG